MIGMSLWYQKREHDTWIKSQINKITLIDKLMIVNSTLMTQTYQAEPVKQPDMTSH